MVDSIFSGGSASGISFSGLSSGIDTEALIAALAKLEQRPIELAQAKQKKLQTLQSLVKSLSTKLSALKDAAAALTTLGQGLAFSATTSDPNKITATAASNAVAGPHTLSVTQLASSATSSATASTAITDPAAALSNTGNVTITYAGTATAIDVSGKTLNEISEAINANVTGVNASVVNVGTSSAADYRLVVTGKDSGAVNSLTFAVDAGVDLAFTQVTAAKNAMFKVDGIDIQRETNTVGDVIPGVSFTLLSATTPGQDVTLTVSTDVSAIKTKIKKFVDAYNDAAAFINTNNTYEAATKIAGAFFGDSAIASIRSQMASLVLKNGAEYTAQEGYNSLSQLGIKLQSDGTLLIDDAKLTEKLSTSVTDALDLFADTDAAGPDKGLALELRDWAGSITNGGTDPGTGVTYEGVLVAKNKAIADQLASLAKQITAGENHVAQFTKMMKQKYAAFEEAISKLKAQQSALYAKFGV